MAIKRTPIVAGFLPIRGDGIADGYTINHLCEVKYGGKLVQLAIMPHIEGVLAVMRMKKGNSKVFDVRYLRALAFDSEGEWWNEHIDVYG